MISPLSFSNYSLCLFHLFLLLEEESGLETQQQDISEKASFHKDMAGKVTRNGSWCSVLEELWKDADHTERDQQNQNKPLHPRAFLNKKNLNTEKDNEYKDPGEIIHVRPHLVSSQKRPHKHCLFAKSLKPYFLYSLGFFPCHCCTILYDIVEVRD